MCWVVLGCSRGFLFFFLQVGGQVTLLGSGLRLRNVLMCSYVRGGCGVAEWKFRGTHSDLDGVQSGFYKASLAPALLLLGYGLHNFSEWIRCNWCN